MIMHSRETTVEELFNGRLLCRQHRHGYRFSHDPVLLAHFFSPQSSERIIDLGSGCGIIPLILAYRWPTISLTALELQPQLAALAGINFRENNFADRLHVIEEDMARVGELLPAAGFERVVTNPPYHPAGNGRLNPDPEQALARHQVSVSLREVVQAADWLLAVGGWFDLVYPFAQQKELLETLAAGGFAQVCLQAVHSYPGKKADLVLVEAVKGGGGEHGELEELPPFYVHRGVGEGYTVEMAGFYEP